MVSIYLNALGWATLEKLENALVVTPFSVPSYLHVWCLSCVQSRVRGERVLFRVSRQHLQLHQVRTLLFQPFWLFRDLLLLRRRRVSRWPVNEVWLSGPGKHKSAQFEMKCKTKCMAFFLPRKTRELPKLCLNKRTQRIIKLLNHTNYVVLQFVDTVRPKINRLSIIIQHL